MIRSDLDLFVLLLYFWLEEMQIMEYNGKQEIILEKIRIYERKGSKNSISNSAKDR